ncbi:protein kinase domain-containing protein [Streptomyces sp. NBC_00829]|uniref:protein kinase domain-containing protein n=1 Tax=Streptomyces sp. NBC_00829 TaxID=2903679 RepID=UPI003870C47F|nr:protein kinase [Streptomyces sp. NBC_00829]
MGSNLHVGPDGASDRYRLLRSIGRGGEAVLYLAEIELAGATEPVVVKVLDSRKTLSPEEFGRISAKWSEQAELLRFVHRLGVVGVREHFEGSVAHGKGEARSDSGRALYLVMNHVDGTDLQDWRADRQVQTPAERREAMRCLEQLAEVLDHLHSGMATPSGRVVVHGDLSPGNVMIDTDGQATLVDFGLSKLAADHRTAEIWFTPGYAAPEVFSGARNPSTDRYAFGAIAYFLLSGDTPAPQANELRAAFLALPFFARSGAPDLEHENRIAAIFSPDPLQRPTALTTWVRDLRRIVGTTTTAAPALHSAATVHRTPTAPPLPQSPPLADTPVPSRRLRGRIVGASVLALAIILGGAYAGMRFMDREAEGNGGMQADGTPSGAASPQTESSPDTASPTDSSPDADSPTVPPEQTSLPLAGVPTLGGPDYSAFSSGQAIVNTKKYSDALVSDYCNTSYPNEYNLNREWSWLSYSAGLTDESADGTVVITVYADDQLVGTQTLVRGMSKNVKIKVKNALRLRIFCDDTDVSNIAGDRVAVLGNPALVK